MALRQAARAAAVGAGPLAVKRDADHGPALRMEGQDLQLDRQVDLTHIDAGRHSEDHRSEIQNARDPRRHDALADCLGSGSRHRYHPDRHAVPGYHRLELVGVPDHLRRDLSAHDKWICVEEGGDAEAPRGEAAVVGQRMAQVAGADDDDGPVLGEPELPRDLVHQVLNVIPDTAGSVRSQVRQVLAQLRRVHPCSGRELLARHGGNAAISQRIQCSKVNRQPVNRCLRDAAMAVLCRRH